MWKIKKEIFMQALPFINRKSPEEILVNYFLLDKDTLITTDIQSAIELKVECDNEDKILVPIKPIKDLFKKSKVITIEKDKNEIIVTTDKGIISKLKLEKDPEMFANIPILFDNDTPKMKFSSKEFIRVLKIMKDTLKSSYYYNGGIFFEVKDNVLDIFATNRMLLKYYKIEDVENSKDIEFFIRIEDVKRMLKVKYNEDIEIYLTKDIIYFITKNGLVILNRYNVSPPDFWSVYKSTFSNKEYKNFVLESSIIDFIVNFLKTLDKEQKRVRININKNGIKMIGGDFNTEIQSDIDIPTEFNFLLIPRDLLDALLQIKSNATVYFNNKDLYPIGIEGKDNYKAILMPQWEV